MKDVAGKVAFITGGASGLGLAMGRSFTAAGMKVVIADIQDDALAAAREEFSESKPLPPGLFRLSRRTMPLHHRVDPGDFARKKIFESQRIRELGSLSTRTRRLRPPLQPEVKYD